MKTLIFYNFEVNIRFSGNFENHCLGKIRIFGRRKILATIIALKVGSLFDKCKRWIGG